MSTLSGYPEGVKFEPTDEQLMRHLAAKLGLAGFSPHKDIGMFIPTIDKEGGMIRMHPEHLPGCCRDGVRRHFFHRPTRPVLTGTRMKNKIQKVEDGEVQQMRWHKTGTTRPVKVNNKQFGCKKIMVLYNSKGRKEGEKNKEKDEKTNWVMHQYHLGEDHMEKGNEWLVSKVFWQIERRKSTSRKPASSSELEETVGEGQSLSVTAKKADESSVTFFAEVGQGSAMKVYSASTSVECKTRAQKQIKLQGGTGDSTIMNRQGLKSCQETLTTTEVDRQSSGEREAYPGWSNVPAPTHEDPFFGDLSNMHEGKDVTSISDVGSSQEPPAYDEYDDVVSKETQPQADCGFENHYEPGYSNLICQENGVDLNCLDNVDDARPLLRQSSLKLMQTSLETISNKENMETKVETLGSQGALACSPVDPLVFADGLICTPPDDALIASQGLENRLAVVQNGGHQKETIVRKVALDGKVISNSQQGKESSMASQEEDLGSFPFSEFHLSQSLPVFDSQEVRDIFGGFSLSQGNNNNNNSLAKQLETLVENQKDDEPLVRYKQPVFGETKKKSQNTVTKTTLLGKKKRESPPTLRSRTHLKREAKSASRPITSFFTS